MLVVCTGRAICGPGLEIHPVRQYVTGPKWMGWTWTKCLGSCCQQLITNLYTEVQIHVECNGTYSLWRYSMTPVICLLTNLSIGTWEGAFGMCTSLKIVNPPAGSKQVELGPDVNRPCWPGQAIQLINALGRNYNQTGCAHIYWMFSCHSRAMSVALYCFYLLRHQFGGLFQPTPCRQTAQTTVTLSLTAVLLESLVGCKQ